MDNIDPNVEAVRSHRLVFLKKRVAVFNSSYRTKARKTFKCETCDLLFEYNGGWTAWVEGKKLTITIPKCDEYMMEQALR